MIIYWETFTWEAFATLLTGVSAVGGAVWVGIRQSGISYRQTQILDRQVRLEELTLKNALFDRRYSYFQLFATYAQGIKNGAELPKGLEDEFVTKSREAKFLFPSDLVTLVEKVHGLAFELQTTERELLVGKPESRLSAEERRRVLRGELTEAVEKFQKIAEPHLHLAT